MTKRIAIVFQRYDIEVSRDVEFHVKMLAEKDYNSWKTHKENISVDRNGEKEEAQRAKAYLKQYYGWGAMFKKFGKAIERGCYEN